MLIKFEKVVELFIYLNAIIYTLWWYWISIHYLEIKSKFNFDTSSAFLKLQSNKNHRTNIYGAFAVIHTI